MLLPVELRERVVDAYNNRKGVTVEELSKQFQVAISTIYEWLRLLAETGALDHRGHSGGWKPLIDENTLKVLKNIVDQKPDLTLKEIKEEFNKKTKKDVSVSTIDRALKRLNLTFKKKHFGPVSTKKKSKNVLNNPSMR
jgi:transposase